MSFPTTVQPKSISFSSNRPNSISYTLSGKRSVRQFASQYFSFSVTMPPMTKSVFQVYSAFLISKKGGFTAFDFAYPVDNLGANRTSTSVKTRTTHAVGSTAIAIDGLSASTNDVIKGGDLIKFNGHTKVYLVVGDVNSNGAGQGTVTIEPPLQSALVNNEVLVLNRPNINVALLQDDILYSTDASQMFYLNFDVREVL